MIITLLLIGDVLLAFLTETNYNDVNMSQKMVVSMGEIRKRLVFHGRVQGVGFRYRAKHLASSLGLTGWVRNEYDGTVQMEVQGSKPMIYKLMEGLNRGMYIKIDWIDDKEIPVVQESSFHVR